MSHCWMLDGKTVKGVRSKAVSLDKGFRSKIKGVRSKTVSSIKGVRSKLL